MHVLSPVNTSSNGLNIYLELISAALHSFGWRGGLSSYMFTLNFWRVWYIPIEYLDLQRCFPTPWIFACPDFSSVSDLDSILRALLNYSGLFVVSEVFGGGSEVVCKFFWSFPRNIARLSSPISTWVSYLVASFLNIWPLMQHLCGISLVSQFPVMTGAPKFLARTALRLQETFQDFSLPSLFIVLWWIKAWCPLFPYLWKASTLWLSFLMFCNTKRIKYR